MPNMVHVVNRACVMLVCWLCAPCCRSALPQMVMAGFLPFSAIYVELYYIFASVWGHKVYIIWSILFIVYIILIVVTAFITVALTYFQLCVATGVQACRLCQCCPLLSSSGIVVAKVTCWAVQGNAAGCTADDDTGSPSLAWLYRAACVAHSCVQPDSLLLAWLRIACCRAVEDHRWWWRSFMCGGSTALFVYGYCFYYYYARSGMSGFMQTSFFFGYNLMVRPAGLVLSVLAAEQPPRPPDCLVS